MYKIRFKYVWIVRNFSLNELKDEDFKHSRRVNGYTGQMKIALKKVKVKNDWLYHTLWRLQKAILCLLNTPTVPLHWLKLTGIDDTKVEKKTFLKYLF